MGVSRGERVDLSEMRRFQRSRLLAAALRETADDGEETSVAAIVARAGVSRQTFYDLFASREECLDAVFDDAVARIAGSVAPLYADGEGEWAQRLRAALVALLAFLECERKVAAFALSYLVGGEQRESQSRTLVLERLRAAIGEGRRQSPADGDRSPVAAASPVTAEMLVAGALVLVHTRVREGSWHLSALANPLMSMFVMPYLGPAAAAKELRRKPPKRVAGGHETAGLSLASLGMRMTYRTARVLEAIAEQPGRSNTEVGERAGIVDAGQTSKLLARLLGYGMVENTRGSPLSPANQWRLTRRGEELAMVIGARFFNGG